MYAAYVEIIILLTFTQLAIIHSLLTALYGSITVI